MKRLLKDKRGSSLVLVIVTMTFLILLAGAIITMTVTNIWLKASQRRSQVNFYTTDSVLDSVAAGIQNESSKASADSYALALAGYNASLTAADDTLTQQYTKQYITTMIDALSGGASAYQDNVTSYQYSDDVLKAYLTAQEQPLYVGHSSGYYDMELRDGSLVLKDVSVYEKEDTYETTLTTDICIDVPIVNTDAHSEYLDYVILADDQILDNANRAVINGNIYSGTVNRDQNQRRSLQGMRITHSGKLEVNAQYIISRGDIEVSDGSALKIDGNGVGDAQVWVENITTDAVPDSNTGNNSITIKGDCRVADDLELNGKNDKAVLSGRYFGYNYSNDYSNAHNVTVDASYSSAISLNGRTNSLDLSGLTTLVLSGRTFISKRASSDAEAANIANLASGSAVNTDIELGTSLSVKSSQLAYYVPADYIKTITELGSGHYTLPASYPGEGRAAYGSRPETDWLFFKVGTTIYAFDFQSYNDYVMPDATAYHDALTGISGYTVIANQDKFDIRDYIGAGTAAPDGSYTYQYNNANPLKVYYRHNTLVSQQPIKYFYLNFDKTDGGSGATSKKSSIFYAVFHEKSPQQTGVYDSVDDRYLSQNGVLLNDNSDILVSSGDILYSRPGQARKQVKIQNSDPMADTILYQFARDFSKKYMSRQLALVPDYSDANSSPLWRLKETNDDDLSKSGINGSQKVSNLFNKLVDVNAIPPGQSVSVQQVTSGNAQHNVAYVVSSGDVTWPLPAPNNNVANAIIIAKGKVTLQGDFNGLILSGDDVELGATNITVNANKKLVEDALTMDKESASPIIYNMLSRYFRKSVDATIGTSSAANQNNVGFENWKKN